MKAFITGVTGFVGSHLADYLLAETDVEVHGLTRWRSPKENILHLLDSVTFHHGDLTDFSSLYRIIKKVMPKYIFHLAAQSYVPYSFDVPAATLDSNVIGTCNLLEAIKIIKEEEDYDPIVHICSSSEVYGQVDEKDIPIEEDCPLKPASPYAVSKVGEDMLGLQYWISYGIKTIRSRMFTHTGPKRGDVFVVAAFAKQIAKIEAGLQEPIIKVGNLDSVRTFADVRDTVRAYWMMVNECKYGEVYNIGGNFTMTIREMLDKLIGMSTTKNMKVIVDKSLLRPSDVTLQIPCVDKFKKETGWEPTIDFDITLKDTLNFWREYYARNK
ncbi:MAG: GDP-mannose 4,6-dehydratase [Candidatus Asgardarchaeia archaeon]